MRGPGHAESYMMAFMLSLAVTPLHEHRTRAVVDVRSFFSAALASSACSGF
jgi:hypothetical protein